LKTEIRLLVPSHGFDTVEVNYTTNPVGSSQLYRFGQMFLTYRGERVRELDTNSVCSMNPYDQMEELIISKTQSSHRRGLEQDEINPRIQKKFSFKKPNSRKGIPE